MTAWTSFQPTYLNLHEDRGVLVANFTRARLSDEENIEQIGQELLQLVEHYNCRRLVVSLRNVVFITSSVLGKLITLHRRMHRKEGRLVLVELDGPVAEVFRMSRLETYFTMASSLDDAVSLASA
ncbi:MAG: STAS domain-containing protein [Planctomycetaceae bacterium]|jgi:anti-sigma B factor antagonist|nr:STAS domain-containing protein [Planctomycetaceae bacterium]